MDSQWFRGHLSPLHMQNIVNSIQSIDFPWFWSPPPIPKSMHIYRIVCFPIILIHFSSNGEGVLVPPTHLPTPHPKPCKSIIFHCVRWILCHSLPPPRFQNHAILWNLGILLSLIQPAPSPPYPNHCKSDKFMDYSKILVPLNRYLFTGEASYIYIYI